MTTASMLYAAALGAAAQDLRRGVKEERTNAGREIDKMLRNAGVNVPAPWCAAAVQDWTDSAAAALGLRNPLDDVKLEAFVQSYYEWANGNKKIVPVGAARRGHLVLFRFGDRWDHIGLLKSGPTMPTNGASFVTIEGNTDDEGGREGIKVAQRTRKHLPDRTCFVAWAD